MRRYLLAGCGYDRARRVDPRPLLDEARLQVIEPRRDFSDGELFTLDTNPLCQPDIRASLDVIHLSGEHAERFSRWCVIERTDRAVVLLDPDTPVPGAHLKDNLFDEIHAYEVLEHLGDQGVVEAFFGTFLPFWRALKPGGYLCGTVPSIHSEWAWGDPGHRRIITAGALRFLSRALPTNPPSSDYRAENPCDFELKWCEDNGANLAFVLQAVKPARPPVGVS